MKNINKALTRINASLKSKYGDKHVKITMTDVNKTYERQLLSIESDAKTIKGSKIGYLTGILYLAPSDLSGFNVCPNASKGCKAACLFSAGRGVFYSVTRARIVKTLAFFNDKGAFKATLDKSIKSLVVKAKNRGFNPVVRLNGTSDLPFFIIYSDIFKKYSNIQFYDYTKNPKNFKIELPSNYHLTFSLSESNDNDAKKLASQGVNVAVVFRNKLPSKYFNKPVINGDNNDLRFLDKPKSIVGLKAKGKAKKDTSGFVRTETIVESAANNKIRQTISALMALMRVA